MGSKKNVVAYKTLHHSGMELAIVGLVGLLGYAASSSGKDSRVTEREECVPDHPQAFPFGPGTSVQAAMDDDRARTQAQWEQSIRPNVTGVITPNTQPTSTLPYYTSAKTQGTNNFMKQRLLETFTGALDTSTSQTGTYMHKSESRSFFEPNQSRMRITSGGSGGSAAMGGSDAARFIPSQLQQNVLPTQQIRVGRGVGVGTDVPASDGFHPMLRIMPEDFGWKKNNLPGVVVPGGSTVASRPVDSYDVQSHHPPRYYAMEQHPPGPGRAIWTGPTDRAADAGTGCDGHSKIVGTDYYGGAGREGSYVATTAQSRNRIDNHPGLPETNVTGARDGVGGFVNSSYDMTRLTGQREESVTNMGFNGTVTGAKAPHAQQPYLLPATDRDTYNAARVGGAGSAVEGGQARPMDRADRTLREQTTVACQNGIASPYIKGATVTGTDKWLDRESKRYGQLIHDWLPPPCLPSAAANRTTVYGAKDRVDIPLMAPIPTTLNPMGMAALGERAGCMNKLPVTNTRLDLNIAKTQLASNDIAIPLVGKC